MTDWEETMPLGLIALLPCIAIITFTLIVRQGFRTWMSLLVVGAALGLALSPLRLGVAQSCRIDESECVGATAVYYLVLALWTPFVIVFLGRIIVVNRAKQ